MHKNSLSHLHTLHPLQLAVLASLALGAPVALAQSGISLANQPIFASSEVPGNLALALSVEWPTATRTAHTEAYTPDKQFLGYFDPEKCYAYRYDPTPNDSGTGDTSYFDPVGKARNRTCAGDWSGNFLNWAGTAAIDPLRWAMTGGRRVVDTTSETILEKGWHSGQGSLFNNRELPPQYIAGATPFKSATRFNIRISGMGYRMRFATADARTALPSLDADPRQSRSPYPFTGATDRHGLFEVTMRTKVCVSGTAAGGLESNCKQYGNHYKPEGLIQQYSQNMRYSAFGYLNDSAMRRDGGVLRAKQKFVGPQRPVPGQAAQTNANAEWSPTTGIFVRNPDAADAAATTNATGVTIADSGVINYLNNFGQLYPGEYKSFDPVSEMYYGVLRYFRNLGNVPEWSNIGRNTSLQEKQHLTDGFPVITDWNDPIEYSCQRNFVLGIGDIYTHRDKNVPGSTNNTDEPAKPAAVRADTAVDAVKYLSLIHALEGINTNPAGASWSGRNNSAYIAGLAYHANTNDLRRDDARRPNTIGRQTVQTYWVDVLEAPFVRNNQFYLAAKYGGLRVPATFDPLALTAPITENMWRTNSDVVGNNTPRPDNYFTAGRPDTMVSGLTQAFQNIANEIKAYTTSFAYTSEYVGSGDSAYATQYDSNGWTGAVSARAISYAADGTPSASETWSTDNTLNAQVAGNGWNNDRRIVTWVGHKAEPFRADKLTGAQKARLDSSFVSGDDSADVLEYLRGNRKHETTSSETGSLRLYRPRSKILGDIVNSKVTPVKAPSAPYFDSSNPGYSAFKATHANRQTMVYVGANDGMLHAFNGATTGREAGKEVFAYIPSAMFDLTASGSGVPAGPDSILANLANPHYNHRYAVDATPRVFDVDFANTYQSGEDDPDWRSILVGGLGKGGKSFYAIDVTDPASMKTEAEVAAKVLWEFTDEDMGYSFGQPTAVKTRKHGWVIIVTSGYNENSSYSYLYLINPRNGALLEKIRTASASLGMAHASAYVKDFADSTTDAVYAGDLNGNLWRFDMTADHSFPQGKVIARLTNASGTALPITTAPLIEVHPATLTRYVLVGTGQLLDSSDIDMRHEQAFFAITDGNASAFKDDNVVVRRSQLRNAAANPIDPNAPKADAYGWYLDLGKDNQIGWRMVSTPVMYDNVIAFTTMLTNGDACSPAGQSRVYALDFGTGLSKLKNNSRGYEEFAQSITDIKLIGVDGEVRLIAGDNQGGLTNLPVDIQSSASLNLLNWREVFSFD